ncbi:MAG: EamA family transporter [Oscillospiraceae bacterium]|nr:EamA family transporter [Oscillospiraceae bacterium]
MLYLIIGILFSSMLSILLRISEKYVKGDTATLAMNYVCCTLVAFLDAGTFRVFSPHPGLDIALILGIIGGFAYLGSFLLLQYNIKTNGVVLPATFMKLGLLVPTISSVIIFRERPDILQIIGFCLAIAAIILINSGKKGEGARQLKIGLLVALLILAGVGDVMSKFHEEWGSADLTEAFLFYIFLTACILCLGVTAFKKQKIGLWEIFFGLIIGIPNYYSSKFVLIALKTLPAVVVFPTFSVGCIVVVTLAGLLLFKEKLTKRQGTALGMIMIALAMLNM